jgi:hypothetical protein
MGNVSPSRGKFNILFACLYRSNIRVNCQKKIIFLYIFWSACGVTNTREFISHEKYVKIFCLNRKREIRYDQFGDVLSGD